MKLADAVREFLAQPRIAVVGLSRRSRHTSTFVFKKLRAPDREVIPVNPAANEINGVRCYPDLKSIPGGVSAVMVVTPPSSSGAVLRECAALGIKHVWLHRAFGAGSSSEEAAQIARAAGIQLIPVGCPAMFCEPVDFGHKCFRWCLRLRGKLPEVMPA